jgi:adenylosuccinate synthase
MPVTVVVGGQYGSEGKGKTAAYFAEHSKAAAVRRLMN